MFNYHKQPNEQRRHMQPLNPIDSQITPILDNENAVRRLQLARKIMSASVKSWAIVLVLCQLIFILYLIFAYASPSLLGNIEAWNGNSTEAYIADDPLGNIAFGMHVLLALVMITGGPLQFVSKIRNKYRAFHRFNGRLYVSLAMLVSIVGIYLIWSRGTVGDTLMHGLTTLSGLIILLCGFFTYKRAVQRNIVQHQIWATRLFIAANGVLYFRIILFGWLMLFGPLGIDFKTFTGPTIIVISIACYVLPILIYELYRQIKASHSLFAMGIFSTFMFALALYFVIGTFGVTMGNWSETILNAL